MTKTSISIFAEPEGDLIELQHGSVLELHVSKPGKIRLWITGTGTGTDASISIDTISCDDVLIDEVSIFRK